MQNVIISDTSCLILLDKIGKLEILHLLFGTIVITKDIMEEYGNPLPEWIKVAEPENKNYQAIIEVSLDKGESSAIALAVELDDCLLIIDDLKGRYFAQQLGLKITGTLGVLMEAKLEGYLPSLKAILATLKQTNFRISEKLENIILKKTGEE